MRKISFAFAFLLLALPSVGQFNQKGKTKLYPQKTPLPHVVVSAAGTQSSKSSTDGTFLLQFKNAHKGDPVGKVDAKRKNYVLQNREAIEGANLGANDLVIYLRDAKDYNKEKRDYTHVATGKRNQDLKKVLSESNANQEGNELTIDSVSEIKERFLNKEEIEKYSDLITRIDKSEIEASASESLDLFVKGDVNSAIKKINGINYVNSLKPHLRIVEKDVYKRAIQAIVEMEVADGEGIKIYNSARLQIYLNCLIRNYEKAKEFQISLAKEMQTFEEYLSCAELCADLTDYNTSAQFYKNALSILSNKSDVNSTYKTYWKCFIEKGLATLYYINKNYLESNAIFHKIIEDIKLLPNDSSDLFVPLLAEVYYLTGVLCMETLDYKESELMFENALSIASERYESIPQVNLSFQVRILRYMKQLYRQDLNWQKMGQIYSQAQLVKTKLNQEDTEWDIQNRVSTLLDLADIYSMHGFVFRSEENRIRQEESESMYEEALALSKALANDDPLTFEPYYASMLSSVAQFYMTAATFHDREYCQKRSETLYRQSLEIYNRLSKRYPNIYDPYIASTTKSIAFLCLTDSMRYKDSETLYKESIRLYKKLIDDYPNLYDDELAGSYYGLGEIYIEEEDLIKAEEMYSKALELFRRLAATKPSPYLTHTAETAGRLASIRNGLNDFVKAEQYYLEAISAYKNLEQYTELTAISKGDMLSKMSYLEELLFKQGKYDDMRPIVEDMVQYLKQNIEQWTEDHIEFSIVNDLAGQSYYAIFFKDFGLSESLSRQAINLNPEPIWYYSNLAAALLFQGKFVEAKKIYQEYSQTLKTDFLNDFKQFEKAGVVPEDRKKDVEKIKKLLSN